MFKDKLNDKYIMIIHGYFMFCLNFVFLEISRNRLAGEELSQGDSCMWYNPVSRFVWRAWQWGTPARRRGLFWLDSWVF